MANTTETLDEWLASQINRGCTLESMIATMQQGGYTLTVAQNYVVNAFVAAGKAIEPNVNQPGQALSTLNYPVLNYPVLNHPVLNHPALLLAQPHPKNLKRSVTLNEQEQQAQLAWQIVRKKCGVTNNITPIMQLDNPKVMVFEHFLTDNECDALIAKAQNKMQDSQVLDPTSGEFVFHTERTSRGTHFEHQSSSVVVAIENRINELFGFCVAQQEATQILHYAVNGEYKPHYDYFPPNETGSHSAIKAAGQRLATLIMYLNTPEKGGATSMPAIGLTVTAKKGNAIYFENIDLQGKPNPQTLHAGMPVLAGEKWIATKWLRERLLF